MKNFRKAGIFAATILFAAVAVTFTSCEKEDIIELADEQPNVELKNGMLNFKDTETYLAVYHQLEKKQEELNDAFSEKNKFLSEEELNEKIIVEGFSTDKAFENFEERYNFNSLRKKIAKETVIWLQNKELDFENNPDDHFVFGDAIRTLLNENAEIQIGKSIFKMTESGTMFEIKNENLTLLSEIRKKDKNQESYLKSDLVVLHYYDSNKLKSTTDYAKNKAKTTEGYYDSQKKKFTVKVGIFNGVGIHYMKGTVKSYQFRRVWGWKQYYTDLRVTVGAYPYSRAKDSDDKWVYTRGKDHFSSVANDKNGWLESTTHYINQPFWVKNDGLSASGRCNYNWHTTVLNW